MPLDLSETWNRAIVAEPMTLNTPDGQEIGAFTLEEDTLKIYSLDPSKDFEIDGRPNMVWNMVFVTSNGPLGIAEYFSSIEKMKPYILDLKNGSVLMRGLSETEIRAVFASTSGVELKSN